MEIHTKQQRRLSEAERAHLLEVYEQSSMTQREFAAVHGIALSTLTKWRRDDRQSNCFFGVTSQHTTFGLDS